MAASKHLDIYFDGSSQRVKYYPGTLKEDIIELTLKLFNKLPVEDRESLKQIEGHCIFHDSDGDPVVFSPDVLPSGTKLFLRIQPLSEGVLNIATPPNIPWHWDALINSHPNIRYSLSENNTCARDPPPVPLGQYFAMPILCANRSITSGRHIWRCFFSKFITHSAFGLISKDEYNILKERDFAKDFKQFPLFYKFWSLDIDSTNLVMRLDMSARICTVETKGTDRQTHQVMDLPEEVWPAFTTKRKHGCAARVYFDV